MKKFRTVAIILAGGSGKRMKSNTAKQYLIMGGKPILYYALKAFEESSIDEIVLVVGKNDIDYCKDNIVELYEFKKVKYIIEGGQERYHSVYNGLKTITKADYVLIHDGARPLVTTEIIERVIEQVVTAKACVVGVPVKDTVKIVNEEKDVVETPDRNLVWNVQTPQAFSYESIYTGYCMIMEELAYNKGDNINLNSDVHKNDIDTYKNNIDIHKKNTNVCKNNGALLNITDDAMVVEHTLDIKIKMILGSYSNIKITTPEDIFIGEALLKSKNKEKSSRDSD